MTTIPPTQPQPSSHLRICVLAASYHPIIGGGERHARLLCRELAARGASVHVLTRRRAPESPAEEHFEGCRITRTGPCGFPRLGKYLMLLPVLLHLWRNRRSIDVLYVCGLRVLGLAGIIAQRLLHIPCILRAEACGEMDGSFIWKTPENTTSHLKKALFAPWLALRNRSFKKAAAFLAISTPIRDEFSATGVPSDKIHLIPNGYDPTLFRPPPDEHFDLPATRRALHLPENALLFAYSGKLNRGKGLERLLRIWKSFANLHPNAHLLLIGSGKGQYLSCENALRDFTSRHHLTSSVTFTGYVDNVTDWLHAADAFLFPSESEAQGLSVLEALACAVPVIASRIPGIMDMVEDGINGRLVPCTDETAWLTALEEFAADPVPFRTRALNAAQTARTRYAIPAIADAHLSLFHTLRPSR